MSHDFKKTKRAKIELGVKAGSQRTAEKSITVWIKKKTPVFLNMPEK